MVEEVNTVENEMDESSVQSEPASRNTTRAQEEREGLSREAILEATTPDGTIIDAHGEVHRSACTSNISIGNIKNRKVELPTKGIICDKYSCSCFTDLQFRKYRTI